MTSPSIAEVAAEAERLLDAQGFLRVAPPPVSMTEAGVERMLRRFYAVAERLDLTVQRQADGALVAYRADAPASLLDSLTRSGEASLN